MRSNYVFRVNTTTLLKTIPKNSWYQAIFLIALLFLASTIRSGIILDRSMLPRVLVLSTTLWITSLLIRKKDTSLHTSIFEISLVLFYTMNLLSCIWAVNFAEAIMQAQLVFLSLMVFFVISLLNSNSEGFERMFIKAQLMVSFFAFALAFYKMSRLEFYDPYQVISVSANNNLFSAYLLISLPFAFSGYAMFRGFWKYLSILCGVLSVFFILIIQSRAGYLALSVAFITLAALLTFRYRKLLNKKNLFTGLAAVILLLFMISIFYVSLDTTRRSYFKSKIPVWNYFRSYDSQSIEKIRKHRMAGRDDHGRIQEFDFAEEYYANANLRMIFWKKSIPLTMANPLLGCGAGNWKIMVASVPDPPNPEHTLKNYTYSQPHNEWIGIFSELGLIGFIISLFLFVIPLVLVFGKIAGKSNRSPAETVFYASFILGFYVFACFDFPLKRVEHNILLFSAWAFLLYKVPLRNIRMEFLKKIPSSVVSYIVFFLLLATILLSLIRLKGEYYSMIMFKNERLNDEKVIECCHSAESRFYTVTPNNLPIGWFEGVAWYRLGNPKLALGCFRKGLEVSPYEVRLLNDYATTLYALRRTPEAMSVLKKTLAYDPYFDEARFNLAAIYFFTGHKDSALAEVRRCRDSEKKTGFLNDLGK